MGALARVGRRRRAPDVIASSAGPLDGFQRRRLLGWPRRCRARPASLADYGADVIWVEPPGGDPCRGDTAACAVFNRGKRSVVLDLATQNGRAHLLDLVATADVAIESWRPGVAERLGVGYDVVHARNPRAVYCSISGFGADGPYRDVPGHEAIVHALVGTMAEQPGFRDGPIFEALPFASIGAAYLSLIGDPRRALPPRGRRPRASRRDVAVRRRARVPLDDVGRVRGVGRADHDPRPAAPRHPVVPVR